MRSLLPERIPELLGPAICFPPLNATRSTFFRVYFVRFSLGGSSAEASTITGAPTLWATFTTDSTGRHFEVG